VGGTEGIGFTFLEETFRTRSAPPEHRLHEKAARAVLKSLLPEQGTEIRGSMQSAAQLQRASGYAQRPNDFAELIGILDGELRLVTPTDPEGLDPPALPLPPGEGRGEGMKCYQLTHDYLVPSLRQWLTRKQQETRRGRAELRLAERAALWNAKPENRRLPSLLEWAHIRLLTNRREWTEPQRKTMRRTARYHVTRIGLAVVLLASLLGVGAWVRSRVNNQQMAARADGLVQAILDAETGRAGRPPALGRPAATRHGAAGTCRFPPPTPRRPGPAACGPRTA
jgi:hypothetical protein